MIKAEDCQKIIESCIKGLIYEKLRIDKSEANGLFRVVVDLHLYAHEYRFRLYVDRVLAAERSLDAIVIQSARVPSHVLTDFAEMLFDQAEPEIERAIWARRRAIEEREVRSYMTHDWRTPATTIYEEKTFAKMHYTTFDLGDYDYDDKYCDRTYDADTKEGVEYLKMAERAMKGAREAKALKESRDSGVSLAEELKDVLASKDAKVLPNEDVKPEHEASFMSRTTQENYERVVRALTEVNTTLALAELEPEKAALGTLIKRAGTTVRVVEGVSYTISPVRFSSLQNRLIVHLTTAGGSELHSMPLLEVLDCFPTFYDFISEELENTAMFDSWAELESHSIIIALDGKSMADALAEDISQGCNEAAEAAMRAANLEEQQRLEQHAHYGNF